MSTQSNVYRLASTQGGVIRREQAFGSGMSRGQVERRLATGEWQRVSTGGYRLIKMSGRLNTVRAAVAILPHATVSHFSAAAVHDIPAVPTDVVSVTVHAQTTHTFPGVRVYRSLDLEEGHLRKSGGLPTTTLERTVVDLAACLKPRHLGIVVDEVLASGRCDVADLRRVLDTVARRGRRGVVALRSVLDERSEGPAKASRLERHGIQLLEGAGLDDFSVEYTIPWTSNRRFDVAFVADRVAVEWDSRRWHTQKEAMRNDRERDRDAVAHGWRVLRFTWEDVQDTPTDVIDTIRTVLGR
jgi:very-short-patch-repair endonuclease